MNAVRRAYYILRCLGPGFAATRLRLALRRRLGYDRRVYAPRPWETIPLADLLRPGVPPDPVDYAAFKDAQSTPFLFPPGAPPQVPEYPPGAASLRQPSLAERIRLLESGRCLYFFRTVPPQPVCWHVNALTGQSADARRPWYELPDFDPAQGDIRTLWEPSRAAWAIDLARAAARSAPSERAALTGLYDHWFGSWLAENPPFLGVNWKCGQETAVRLIAHALALRAFGPAGRGPRSWQSQARFAWASAYRIFHHIDYAVSQKNNHAISEACGLIVASQLFPELRHAPRWRRVGREVLVREVRRQFYADGSYVQHSLNYQRVAMHGVLLALRLCELAGDRLPPEIYDAVGRGAEFLFELMDAATGRVPNYGNNDGALILPLSECDFSDFRPIVQAAMCAARCRPLLPPGPWDEEALWLTGCSRLSPAGGEMSDETGPRGAGPCAPSAQASSRAFPAGGYYTLRGGESWAMLRCHTYRDRPGQLDSLHLDLWWRGHNVLRDSGTYQYYAPDRPALAAHFKSLAAHNTIQIGAAEPVEHVSRFLWFPWPRGRLLRFEVDRPDGVLLLEVERRDYDRAPWHIRHRRSVIGLPGDTWLIVDDLLGRGRHSVCLRWQLADSPCERADEDRSVLLRTPAGAFGLSVVAAGGERLGGRVVRGQSSDADVQGWHAPYYGELLAAPALEVRAEATLPVRLLTLAQPQRTEPPVRRGDSDRGQLWAVTTPVGRFELTLAGLVPYQRAFTRAAGAAAGAVRAVVAAERQTPGY